jgi:hypothetical protein
MKQLSRLLLPRTLPVQEEKEEMEKPGTFLVQKTTRKMGKSSNFLEEEQEKEK